MCLLTILLSDLQYVVRDIAKSTVGKDKSTYIMVPKPDDKQISEKSVSVAASGTDVLEAENGTPLGSSMFQ